MRARVFDRERNEYYRSEVYGIINCHGDNYIVKRIENGKAVLKLVPYLDFTKPDPYQNNIECIDNNGEDNPWIYIEQENMDNLNQQIKHLNKECHYFWGYEFLWAQQEILLKLLVENIVEIDHPDEYEIDTRLKGWNYIETQEDIDLLMKEFWDFEDSVLREFHYISGDGKMEDGSRRLTLARDKEMQMIFDDECDDERASIEIIFTAPRIAQLVPPWENGLAGLYDASIFIKDFMVYFYDSKMEEIPDEYDGIYVLAMGMRWRKI